MEYNSLYDLITYLQYGTKLHIGVLFFGDYGNEKCILPFKQKIHASKICDEFKSRENGLKRCFRCKNSVVRKAYRTKDAFDGLCINGVYEYTRPVIIDDDIVCIIHIGNILEATKGCAKLKKNLGGKDFLIDTLEKNFTLKKCEVVGSLLETYIRTLLENVSRERLHNFTPLIENIKTYIESNLEYDIKIPQIAKAFRYNEQYLGRLFKKETHISISSYICERRIRRAKTFLKETDDSIINISLKSGFNNVTYFNRIFKKYSGMTPSEFRAQNKTKKDLINNES